MTMHFLFSSGVDIVLLTKLSGIFLHVYEILLAAAADMSKIRGSGGIRIFDDAKQRSVLRPVLNN